uniref:MmcB family DNA repair protein n=1 Tax=Globodera pallida TaxID=36090 RepID=A0A183CN41_GLOPA
MPFRLPAAIRPLLTARNALRQHYESVGLNFTFDGNLVGDIGEAVAAELFGLKLLPRCSAGIDATAPDGRTVQVKATGTGRGAAFRLIDTSADHLIFLDLNFETSLGDVIYNGPEHVVRACLPATWTGQRSVSYARLKACNATVSEADRLRFAAT